MLEFTNQWLDGEIFEGKVILAFGILLFFISYCFWKFGFSINAKSMIIPTIFIGLLHTATGFYMIQSNHNRKTDFQNEFHKNPTEFQNSEIKRVEGFIALYPLTRYVSIAFILFGFLLFNFLHIPIWKSIALCLMIVGFSIILIDFFSEERALIYQKLLHDPKK